MNRPGVAAALALPALSALLLATACGGGSPEPGAGSVGAGEAGAAAAEAAAPPFTDEAAAAGLDFVHFNGMAGRLHIVEEMGAGVALFDYDGDGDLDVYLVQGAFFDGVPPGEGTFPPRHPLPLTDRLYRNELVPAGELRFTDVTAAAGLAPSGHGMGVAAGDFDGDGRLDLYVTAWGPNRLLRNRGDGTFEDVTERAGAGDDRWSVPAAFFDYDGDGHLDLWIGNYLELPAELPVCRDATGTREYCGPSTFTPAADRLLRNRGDGTFEDVTAASGFAAAKPAPALGVVAADLDGDGLVDLYVANDGEPNHLWINLGGGRFEERGLLAGVAVNAEGKAEASMGVDAGDADGDGELDLFATHLIVETNTLWLARGGGAFEDGTAGTGLGPASRPFTGFGAGWIDYDGDGRQDLLVVNGAVNRLPELVRRGDPHPLGQVNQLFRNLGPVAGGGAARGDAARARFAEVTAEAGEPFALVEVSRAAAFGDLDGDGDVDVVVTHNAGPVRLLVNRAGDGGAWVGVRVTTGEPPRDAPGARVDLVDAAGRVTAASRVRVEGSYLAASDPRVVFRLGPAAPPEAGAGEEAGKQTVRIRVSWGDGTVERFEEVATGRYTTLHRGTGRTERDAGPARDPGSGS